MDKAQIIFFTVKFVEILRSLIVYAIIGRVLMSWFTMGQMRPAGRIFTFLYDVTDPFINLAKKIPHRIGMIDLSPIIALFAVDLLGELLIRSLVKLL